MALGIDLASTLRLAEKSGVYSLFEARGIAPCRNHAPDFIWSNKRVQHQTSYEGVISFEKAWSSYLSGNDTTFTYEVEGQELNKPWDSVVVESFQKLIKPVLGKTAIAVDNSFSEAQQDQLLSLSSQGHLSNVDLIWRPVAIALDFLENNPHSGVSEGVKLLIVDAESTNPEATVLELRSIDGYLVPLRKFFRKDDALKFTLSTTKASRKLALKLTNDDEEIARAIQRGEFLGDFARFRNGDPINDTWIKRNQRFESFEFNRTLEELLEDKNPYGKLVTECRQKAVNCGADIILWHGWPMRCRKDLNRVTDYIMPDISVVQGAKLYSERVEAGLPSYMELLPKLEIYSINHKTNRPEFFTIIKEREYPGGCTIEIDPINSFDIERGIESLPVILRRNDWECSRKVEFDNLPEIEENAPITITGHLVPGQGHLQLRMLSRDGRENLFGNNLHIDINWDTMEEFHITEQQKDYYPDAYPVLGRVFDEDDPEMRVALRTAVNAHSIDTIVNYCDHQVNFKKLLEPWGYHWPWMTSKGRMAPTCSQSPRGLFCTASKKDTEIDQLAADLAKIIENENPRSRHKFMNYMFVYSPESFKQELRDIFSKSVSQLDPKGISTNTVYGVGRVFDRAEDVELFFRFIINSSGKYSWPCFPKADYTKIYFWSVFRCLCYYQESSKVDSDLASKVCEIICNFLEGGNPNLVEKKYCLCALLFLTRIREHSPFFLDPTENLAIQVVDTITKKASNVRFPPSMGITGSDGDNLSQFTIRFINKKVTENDFTMLKGLVTSS